MTILDKWTWIDVRWQRPSSSAEIHFLALKLRVQRARRFLDRRQRFTGNQLAVNCGHAQTTADPPPFLRLYRLFLSSRNDCDRKSIGSLDARLDEEKTCLDATNRHRRRFKASICECCLAESSEKARQYLQESIPWRHCRACHCNDVRIVRSTSPHGERRSSLAEGFARDAV